jgi:hypothetical protein
MCCRAGPRTVVGSVAELETPNRLLSALRYFTVAALPFIFLWVAIEKGFEGQSYRALACLGAAVLSFVVAVYWYRIIPARFRDEAKELEYLRTEPSFNWVALPFTFSFIAVERFLDGGRGGRYERTLLCQPVDPERPEQGRGYVERQIARAWDWHGAADLEGAGLKERRQSAARGRPRAMSGMRVEMRPPVGRLWDSENCSRWTGVGSFNHLVGTVTGPLFGRSSQRSSLSFLAEPHDDINSAQIRH